MTTGLRVTDKQQDEGREETKQAVIELNDWDVADWSHEKFSQIQTDKIENNQAEYSQPQQEISNPAAQKQNLEDILAYFHNIIGEHMDINPDSQITFYLNEDRWRYLLDHLKDIKFPEVNKIKLEYVPEDSNAVREFMANSLQRLHKLNINCSRQSQLNSSVYIEALKVAASKTSDVFRINFTDFSTQDFCGLIAACQNTKKVVFRYCKIALDLQCNLGPDLQQSQIEKLDFGSCGGSSFSDWRSYPLRFENLINWIANWPALWTSLKTLCINGWGISRETAQGVLDQFGLYDIGLTGV